MAIALTTGRPDSGDVKGVCMSQSQVGISVAFFGTNKRSLLSIHQQRVPKRIDSQWRGHKINIAGTFADRAFPPPAVAKPFLHFRRESPFNNLGRVTSNNRKVRNVFGYDAARSHHRAKTNASAIGTDDNGITDPGIMLDYQR